MANFGGASRGFIKSKVGSGGSAVPAIFTRGEGGYADLVPRTGTTFRHGRRWFTDFSSQSSDAAQFTISGFTYGTDGSIPVITLTTGNVMGSILTKTADLRDVDIRVKWKAVASTTPVTYNITNIDLRAIGRYVSSTDMMYANHNLAPGAKQFSGVSWRNNSTLAAVSSPTAWIDNSNTTTYRYTRLRVLYDILYIKHWFEGSAEPDWQYIGRIKPADNSSSSDSVDIGQAGLTAIYGGTISELQIIELYRSDDNLLFNNTINQGIANQTADNNWPVGWTVDTTPINGNAISVVQDVDPWGITRNLFRLDKPGSQTGAGIFWTQHIYDGNRLGLDAFGSRRRQFPSIEFPNYVEISLWTKGINIQHNLGDTTGNLGSVVDIYFYDKDGNILNVGTNYYHSLGPNGTIFGAGGNKGDGTWDWFQTRWRTTFKSALVKSMRFQVGFHDDNASGSLLFCDPVIRGIG